jgi:glycosyltransferase involved in cell wall biosynthesis
MRIVYVAKTVIPSNQANSIHIMKMCQAFSNNRHHVRLIIPQEINIQNNIRNVYSFYGVEEIFFITYVPLINLYGKYLLFALFAVKKARHSKVDILYTRHLPSAFFSCISGIKTVYELHDPGIISGFLMRMMFEVVKKSKYLRKLVVISSSIKNYMVSEMKFESSKIYVAHDGADETKFTQHAGSKSTKLNIGYIGHLYPGKGMEIVYELAKRMPDVHFMVVGGSENDITIWKEKTRDMKNIVLHGFIEPSKTDAFRASCDILLAPFQKKVTVGGTGDISQWMSPLKVFEYMAARRPMIVSNIPVLREVLNSDNAVLVEHDNINAWVAAVDYLRDPSIRKRIADIAYSDFAAKYTWKKRAENICASITL